MLDGLERYRRVGKMALRADPDRRRMVSPGLMTGLIIVVQTVVLVVLVLLIANAFES